MGSVGNAILIWVLMAVILAGVGLIFWAIKRPKAEKEKSDDTAVAPHRLDRLRQVHDQVKITPRPYSQPKDSEDSRPY